MNDPTPRLAAVVDKTEIVECIVRLARGEDRRDEALISASFADDAIIDMGVFRGSYAEYIEWVVPGDPSLPVTSHALGQSYIELDDEAARVETYVTSYHRVDTGDEHRDTVIGGRYLDVLAKRDGVWLIVERTLLYDWFRDDGVAVDWSEGVMGLPFMADHYTGQSSPQGDYSDRFFSKG